LKPIVQYESVAEIGQMDVAFIIHCPGAVIVIEQSNSLLGN